MFLSPRPFLSLKSINKLFKNIRSPLFQPHPVWADGHLFPARAAEGKAWQAESTALTPNCEASLRPTRERTLPEAPGPRHGLQLTFSDTGQRTPDCLGSPSMCL